MAKKEKEEAPELIIKQGEKEAQALPKPTAEEIEQCKKDFETALETFHATRWDISPKGAFAANDVGLFLLDFMKRFAFWTKTGWMGMIKMEEEIQLAMKAVTEDTCFNLDYQALEFCAYMLSNPGGVGLQLALDFEKIADKYAKISVDVATQQEAARKMIKHVAYLQERYAAAEQGFYMAELELEEGEECEDCEDKPVTE